VLVLRLHSSKFHWQSLLLFLWLGISEPQGYIFLNTRDPSVLSRDSGTHWNSQFEVVMMWTGLFRDRRRVRPCHAWAGQQSNYRSDFKEAGMRRLKPWALCLNLFILVKSFRMWLQIYFVDMSKGFESKHKSSHTSIPRIM